MELLTFKLPNGDEFKLPVQWWREAGMVGFERQSPFYRCDAIAELLVRLHAIEPPPMERRQHLDYGGFGRDRMVSILHAIVSRTPLPPVSVEERSSEAAYPYAVHCGAHRFFASVAAGFTHVPAMLWRGRGS
jgi:hypothetical protein